MDENYIIGCDTANGNEYSAISEIRLIDGKSTVVKTKVMENNPVLGVGYCPTCLNISEECDCQNLSLNNINTDWFDECLVIGSYPYMHSQHFNNDYNHIINVSDEFYWKTDKIFKQSNTNTFWFPMSEQFNDAGLNSIYGALVILYNARENNEKVYLHCHAGVNRSEIVKGAFYYMINGEHIKSNEKDLDYVNRFVRACNVGILPEIDYMEKFLKYLNKFLINFKGEPLGGLIDEIKKLL